MSNLPITLDRLDDISERYRVILCDVWGVVHNGVHVFADAIAALQRGNRVGENMDAVMDDAPHIAQDHAIAFADVIEPVERDR